MDRIIHFLMTFLLVFSAFLARASESLDAESGNSFSMDMEESILLVTTWQNEKRNFGYFKSRFPFALPQVIITDKNQTPEHSTGDIVKALRESRGKVSLFCMEKAAADCLEALLQYPKVQKKVGKFISFRGFIQGAGYAENSRGPLEVSDVSKAEKIPLFKALRFLLDSVAYLVDGHDPAIYAMNPQQRSKYLEKHSDQIRDLSEGLELISLETGHNNYGVIPYSKTINSVSL